MRIAINGTFMNKHLTGIGVFTREVARELLILAPDTLIFTPCPELFPADAVCIATPLRFQGAITTANNIGRFLYINSVLPVLLRRWGVDVLYCPILEYPFSSQPPTVLTIHDLHPLYFPDQFGAASLHFRAALKWAGRRSDPIIVPSRYVKRELSDIVPEAGARIRTVALGYDRSLFQPQDPAGRRLFVERYGIPEPYILFVGSLFPYKNLRLLLDAFRRIRHLVPHHLVVLGRTEVALKPPVPEPGVHYLGYAPAADLPGFYSYADLYVQPSLAEGFGLTVVEAMACGTPVLASNAGSLPEVVGSAALLFDPHDSQALAQLMLKTLTDADLGTQLARRGSQHARGFSWRETALGILQVAERAARGATGRDPHGEGRSGP